MRGNRPRAFGGRTSRRGKLTSNKYLQYVLVIDSVHRRVYDTFRFLEGLHSSLPKLSAGSSEGTIWYHRLLIHYHIIELVCQYIELVGSYSVACRETGLLYPHRVFSIQTNKAIGFFDRVGDLTDNDLCRIFNPRHPLTIIEIQDMRNKYTRIAEFYSEHRSLYNAIKHGSRVYPLEIMPTDVSEGKLRQPYLALQWVHVYQGRKRQCQVHVHTWDNRDIQLTIQDQEIQVELFPSEDLSAYRTVMDDCHAIIERIQANNASQS